MTIAGSRPGRKFPSFVFAALVVTPLLASSPSPARAEVDCLLNYANCVDAASGLRGIWRRSGEGILCYLDLLSCLERRLA